MNEDILNTSIRKFLLTSQREIEKAVRAAMAAGKPKGNETLSAVMTLKIGALDLTHEISSPIELE